VVQFHTHLILKVFDLVLKMLKIRKINHLFSVVLFIGIVFPTSLNASSDTAQEVTPADRQKILEKLKELAKDTQTLTATVTQEKQLLLLKGRICVNGSVIMKKPNMFRWDMVKPDKAITVIDGEAMTIYHPDVKEAQVYNLSENPIARNTLNFFTTTIWGSLTELEKKFAVNIFRKDGEIVFKLVPLSKMVGRYLSSILIYYDEETGFPLGFEMITPKGEKTVTRLSNIKINPEIKTDVFKLKLPEDVCITNNPEQNQNDITNNGYCY